MDTDYRQLTARLGVGIRHAYRVTLVAGSYIRDTGFDQRMRDLEVRGSRESKTPMNSELRQEAANRSKDGLVRRRSDVITEGFVGIHLPTLAKRSRDAARRPHGSAPEFYQFRAPFGHKLVCLLVPPALGSGS
jgi:hypothetical protein